MSKNLLPIVLKFGSSVLRTPSDTDAAASEIMRYCTAGQPVVAVVSAFEGETDRLFASARATGLDPDAAAFADHVAQGETGSARALVEALSRRGVSALYRSPLSIGFRAKGPRRSATPIAINAEMLKDHLLSAPILVIPGYAALDARQETVLLGRGGSDISAACIAKALGSRTVHLKKDVDGVYDQDPNQYSNAQRHVSLDYETALTCGGVLIQPEAIRFAQKNDVAISVSALGQDEGSLIGNLPIIFAQSEARSVTRPVVPER